MGCCNTKPCLTRLNQDLALIDGGFADHLRARCTSAFTSELYCRFMRQVARFVSQHRRCLTSLRRSDVAWVLHGCLPGWKSASRRSRRSGLLQWLKFNGRFSEPARRTRWRHVTDAYVRFLWVDRGLAACTQERSLRVVERYLDWQFRGRLLRWRSVRPNDLRRYAVLRARVLQPKSVNDTLSILRQFFRFLHMRGLCAPSLVYAVPSVADYGRLSRPEVLDAAQWQALLTAFDRRSGQGRRDFAIALCLLELGLRSVEVARLRLDAIDWEHKTLSVPPAKAGRGRLLPLPPAVAVAFRRYLQLRSPTQSEQLFVGQTELIGRPLSAIAIRAVIDRAYRRGGLAGLYGTHRLRHPGCSPPVQPPRRSPICSGTDWLPRPIDTPRRTISVHLPNLGRDDFPSDIDADTRSRLSGRPAAARLCDAFRPAAYGFRALCGSLGCATAAYHGIGDALGLCCSDNQAGYPRR